MKVLAMAGNLEKKLEILLALMKLLVMAWTSDLLSEPMRVPHFVHYSV